MTAGSHRERFELESFEWKAPDRLEVAGTFHELPEVELDEPVLVVHGADGTHRLVSAPETGPPEDEQPWRVQFVWTETPVGVEEAELQLRPDIVVDLPAPGTSPTLLRPRFLHVRRAEAADVSLQAELVATEQRAEELRTALERAEADLARARADLDTERQGRAEDAERFREGLERVRASAEQALEELRGQLEAAEEQREALREQAAAGEELRTRVTTLEQAGGEADEIRDEAQHLLERLAKLSGVLHRER